MIIKGWSVTLSLAAIALAFQHNHYILFLVGAVTAASFWLLEVVAKGHPLRYYSRMRDIEVACYHLNAVELCDVGVTSSPRIDMTWGYKGEEDDWRNKAPERRSPANVRRVLHLRLWMPHVMLPHAVAVALGAALFILALAGTAGLAPMNP